MVGLRRAVENGVRCYYLSQDLKLTLSMQNESNIEPRLPDPDDSASAPKSVKPPKRESTVSIENQIERCRKKAAFSFRLVAVRAERSQSPDQGGAAPASGSHPKARPASGLSNSQH